MHNKKLVIDTDLNEKYAGVLVRNLPVDRAIRFVFSALTLSELSEVTGLANSYLSAIKTGRRQPTQEMSEKVYEWYLNVSEFPVGAESLHNVTPIYYADNVRIVEQSMREYFAEQEKISDKFKQVLRGELRATRKDAPASPDYATADDVAKASVTGVLEQRNGYDIETTPSGRQRYIRLKPDDWYDEDGKLLNMNQRMMRSQKALDDAKTQD